MPFSKGRDGLAPALDQRQQRPRRIAWKGGGEPCEHHAGAPSRRCSEEGGPEAEDRRTAGQLWTQHQAAGFTHTPPSPPTAAPRGGHEAGFCRRRSLPRTTPQKGRKQDSSFAWRLQPHQPLAALVAQCLPRSFPTSPCHRGLSSATYLARGGRGLNRSMRDSLKIWWPRSRWGLSSEGNAGVWLPGGRGRGGGVHGCRGAGLAGGDAAPGPWSRVQSPQVRCDGGAGGQSVQEGGRSHPGLGR